MGRPLQYPGSLARPSTGLVIANGVTSGLNNAIANFSKQRMQNAQMQMMAQRGQMAAAQAQRENQRGSYYAAQAAALNAPVNTKKVNDTFAAYQKGAYPDDAAGAYDLNPKESALFKALVQSDTAKQNMKQQGTNWQNRVDTQGQYNLEGRQYAADQATARAGMKSSPGQNRISPEDKVDYQAINHLNTLLYPKDPMTGVSSRLSDKDPDQYKNVMDDIQAHQNNIDGRAKKALGGSQMPPVTDQAPSSQAPSASAYPASNPGPTPPARSGGAMIPYNINSAKSALPGDMMNVPGQGIHRFNGKDWDLVPSTPAAPIAPAAPQAPQAASAPLDIERAGP